MRIRLLKPLNYRKVGTVLDVADGVAEMWIRNKKAETVETTMTPPRSIEVEVSATRNTQPRRGRKRTA